jgi:transcriptional regulator with XRE-family HTH domain
MEDRDRINAISDMIQEYWGEKESREKRRISLNDLAVHFGVNPTSLSYWHRRVREPDPKNKDRLARKIGFIKFYKAIGEQPRVPEDPKSEMIMDLTADENITEGDLDDAIRLLEKRREERRKKREPAAAS